MTENCPEALAHMSCNVLVVSALADEIHDTIKIVTKKVRNLLNKDLSLTTSSTREILKSEFSKYFVWLRLHQDGLIKICRNNEIFCSVNKSVKAWLKGEEYESPTQIVDRYNQKYRKYLTNMNIPLQAFRIEDIRQAVKDIKRDTIMLNNVRYCSHEGISLRTKSKTVNGIIENQKNDCQYSYETNTSDKASDNDLHESNCTINSTDKTQEKKIQSNSHNNLEDEGSENVFLVDAVVQKLYDSLPEECHQNMMFHVISNVDHSFSVKHVLSDEDKDEDSGENKEKEKVDITDNFHNNVCESLNEQNHDEDVSSLEFEKLIVEECIGDIPSISTFSYLEVEHVSADSFEMISAGDVNSVFQNSELGSRMRAYSCNCSASKSGCESPRSDTSMCSTVRTNEIPRSTYNNDIDNSAAKLHEIVLEMLLNQVLLAASRTTAGGDAYIMLENLYGGEGLLFSPRSYKMEQRRLSIVEDPREQNVIIPSSGYNRERDDFNSYPLDDRYVDGGDDSTHVYQSNSLEKCRKREKSYSGIEIAISSSGVRVVLKEQYNLLLKESLEQNMELSLPLISFECTTTTHINYPHTNYCTSDLYQKLLYNTENICRRNITIEPIIFR